ncbi:uncharacterized protein EI90DRAFT_87802 [Cantharellus anzutake]|uniref:uncharacterized protein n=1 Tax=Cantharellus anzutake TaxID=1750568 RepID=UPI0019055797|nr:uncharacterized protein EI90DRAFT_87802 [Cantharellus anzutake]KAF8336929.1 hypothetical protein EI90DRAFT_87802 [Cantharellus anzutake]
MLQDRHPGSQAPPGLLAEDGHPDAQPRKHNKACHGCQTNNRKRRCDRDWTKKDARCSQCVKLRIPCEKGNKSYNAAVDVAGTPSNIINDASHETPPVDAGNTSGRHDQGRGSEPSPVCALPLNTDISLGIWFAEYHFPGIFDEQRFMQRLMLSRDVNPDEYFSLMLHRVFLLSASKRAAESRKLLSEALRAFSEEFEEPSIATIMAATLLSSLLSKAKPQLAGDLLSKLLRECTYDF